MRKHSDYHTHTILCKHAKGEIDAYIQTALDVNLEEIGFADHAPEPIGFDPGHRMDVREMPEYVNRVEKMRMDSQGLSIRLGLEVDCYLGFEPFIEKLRNDYPVEYTIGSVHFIQGMSIFHTEPLQLSDEDSRAAIQGYFDLVQGAARAKVIDIIGHLDVLKLVMPDARRTIYEIAKETLNIIAEEGKVLEMNLSGLRKPVNESYPDAVLLEAAAELKIPVCLGGDAHRPEQVGMHFEKAVKILRQVGYTRQGKAGPGLNVFIPG